IQKENKEFAFTRLITCGLCGSGITAEEKFKKQKNGNVHRYVYYGCTRSRDLHCKGGYIREEELISQLTAILDKINVNKLGIQAKFEKEMERYNKFRRFVLGLGKDEKLPDEEINIKTYAKYLLNEGTIIEKRELLGCLKSKLIIKNKTVQLEK
ncbi:MAG: zinc ribbon domain-containing protein, partial [Thermotogota bacterium]|nr:zinc ribbon domain-containing protein [Thermotogota bacterium]